MFREDERRRKKWPPKPAAMAFTEKDKPQGLHAYSFRDHTLRPGERPSYGLIRIPLPADDPFRSLDEKRGKAPDAVPQHLPHATQGLGIHETYENPLTVPLADIPDPLREAKIFRLEILRVLVDLLCMNLPPHPRSLQERFAVGSVVEARKHRRHDLDEQLPHALPPDGPG